MKELVATGNFQRGGSVVLSDGRTGYVVGYEGTDRIKVQTERSATAPVREIVTAQRASAQ